MRAFAAAILMVMLAVQPVSAVVGTITLDQPQPIHHGDTITFTATISQTAKDSTWLIHVDCYQDQAGGALWVYAENKPFGSAFLLDSTYWDPTLNAQCLYEIIYTVTYGGGKVKHSYLGETNFTVLP